MMKPHKIIILFIRREKIMRSKKYVVSVLCAIFIFLMLCGGCQKNDKDDATAKGKEITYFYNASNEVERKITEEAIKRYEKKSGNTVKTTTMEGESYKTKIKTSVASNTLPDVFNYWTGEQFQTIVESGNVMDLSDLVNADTEYKQQFIDGAFDEVTVRDKVYGIPTSVTGQIMFFNKTLFEKAGISEVPSTIEELEEACDKLNDAGITPIICGSKDRWPLLGWFSYLAVRYGGVELYTDVTNGKSDTSFANPEFVRAGKKLNEISQKYFINGSMAIDSTAAPAQFTAGQAAIFIGGTWDIGTFASEDHALENIEFAPFPAAETDEDAVYGGIANCMAVGASSDKKEEAYDLIKEIMSVETETKKVEETGSLSCMKVDVDKDKMIPLAYDLTEYFNKRASGFFPYTDQALNPEQAERLLNAMTEIIASPDADVEEQLQAIK